MKNLRTALMCLCTIIVGLQTFAQGNTSPVNEPDYNRPKLFNNLPDRIVLETSTVGNMLTKEMGQTATISLSADQSVKFEGTVVSSVSKYDNTIRSIVIRSVNYSGATLTITRVTKNDDSAPTYTGRMMSLQHGDLYELKEIDGSLILIKKNFYDLVNE
ncbi:MAG: hypothetical protein IPH18_13680 [Chitinophagaceae bacterium]|nr:hypothetical protein [Chitinophagaceae bacterium]MBK8952340.1 hypothetical protein [Chitinophagaceae bacterium]